MTIYPLTIRETTTTREGETEIAIVVTREGWTFAGSMYEALYNTLPVLNRIELRKDFELQVQLAQKTPTKGDQ
jgi:hypothetical protein